MIRHVLLAVDDSPASLSAARIAIELAAGWEASVRAVTVVRDHTVAEQVAAVLTSAEPGRVELRRAQAAGSVLRHVARAAARAGVPVETLQLDGEPAACILEQARSWPADLIVLGRSDRGGTGRPYVGSRRSGSWSSPRSPSWSCRSPVAPEPSPPASRAMGRTCRLDVRGGQEPTDGRRPRRDRPPLP
jgi:nucleotide-binding universal stress UspA family protein